MSDLYCHLCDRRRPCRHDIKRLEGKIDALVPPQPLPSPWVACSERLPDESVPYVFAWSEVYKQIDVIHYFPVMLASKFLYTHWMLPPDPPTVGK